MEANSNFFDQDFFLGCFDAIFEEDAILEEFLNDEGFDLLQVADVEALPTVDTGNANAVTAPASTLTTGDERPTSDQSTRFAKVTEGDLQNIIDGSKSKATHRNTVWGVKLFREWLQERGYPSDFENKDVHTLNNYLRSFYAEVRNSQGEIYSKSTFVGLRAAINRHMRSPPFERDIDIMNDKEFHTANNVFVSIVRNMKKEGLDDTKHHAAIPATELAIIRDSFDISTPAGLFNKVWFDITLGFARRGNENQSALRASSFQVSVDEDGCEYIEITHSELTKNHRGNLTDSTEPNKRIYATGDAHCPVSSFKQYKSHMNPKNDAFFQHPKSVVGIGDTIWYTSRCVGKNLLSTMMKKISKNVKLSNIYTNHCLRATAVTLLSHAGIENREICKITGHRNDQSLKSYCTESSSLQKRSYSAILQGISDRDNVANKCPRIDDRAVGTGMYSSGSSNMKNSSMVSVMGMFQGIHNSTINVSFVNR